MAQFQKKRVVVHVAEGRPGAPFADHLAAIESALGARKEERVAAVEAAKRELAPVVEESRALLAEVGKLGEQHARTLRRVLALDLRDLQLRYELPELLVRRLERMAHDAQDFLASAVDQLLSVPKQVSDLAPGDLVLRNYATRFEGGGLHAEGPTRIRALVGLYREAVKAFPARMEEIENLVAQLQARIDQRAPRDVKKIALAEEDEPTESTIPERAETAFDVFEN
jgi:hypothetical protein